MRTSERPKRPHAGGSPTKCPDHDALQIGGRKWNLVSDSPSPGTLHTRQQHKHHHRDPEKISGHSLGPKQRRTEFPHAATDSRNSPSSDSYGGDSARFTRWKWRSRGTRFYTPMAESLDEDEIGGIRTISCWSGVRWAAVRGGDEDDQSAPHVNHRCGAGWAMEPTCRRGAQWDSRASDPAVTGVAWGADIHLSAPGWEPKDVGPLGLGFFF
jgi:hypothetical protein